MNHRGSDSSCHWAGPKGKGEDRHWFCLFVCLFDRLLVVVRLFVVAIAVDRLLVVVVRLVCSFVRSFVVGSIERAFFGFVFVD